MSTHQADSHLQVLFQRLLVEFQHANAGRSIDGDRFFHEDVESLFDRVRVVQPAKCGRSREYDDIAGTQGIHRVFIRIETDKTAFFRDINCPLEPSAARGHCHTVEHVGKPLFEDISQGNQLDGPLPLDAERLNDGS